MRSAKEFLWKISQNSQENTCDGVLFCTASGLAWNFIKKETLPHVFTVLRFTL